ncbi:hypothetical protein Pst134EA_022444 [Puccinia striiformis f. sp. tritici]|uniref:hypothetical protein n=1 Tax=Puccinia striiformis f. sp. tritici TaxID=168172 RepID=UPI00200869AB|nr:hypothetical protein Pst134EA_022444 [Puccinia striiformis f. sp. tritici]KAH9445479.1 hypothetical protein Pst134EB_023321 [Puccinia striiformis f. sp. tritici]KAH9454955.1 hypothetical protein Pst134EA_022444 [Puccinia striiformis f. sp. tritici]
MLRFLILTALVLLVASWQVTDTLNQDPGDILFWCQKNVDAVCSETIWPDGGEQRLRWATRLRPKKRNYKCPHGTRAQCCWQDWYKDINNGPDYFMKIASGPVPYCDPDGQ